MPTQACAFLLLNVNIKEEEEEEEKTQKPNRGFLDRYHILS